MNKKDGKLVLGISAFFHDSAATLVHGNQIVAAAQEERFSRKKADWRFPQQAIAYCLSQLPENTEIDAVAFYENPALKTDRILHNAINNAPRGVTIWKQTLQTLNTLNSSLPNELLAICNDPKKIYFTSHHRSHAASAFYASPFDNAAILIVDGVGEWSTTSIWSGNGNKIKPLKEIKFPHSLGLLYSAFTQYCGFRVNTGEYKLMGLAPFGKPVYKNQIYKHLIKVNADGSFALNLDYFSFETSVNTISPLFCKLFRYQARHPSEQISTHYMNMAASIQAVLNEIMLKLAQSALTISGSKNLCMAGGVSLNCLANTEIARKLTSLNNIWVQPAAGDAGGALGAALDISVQLSSTTTRSNTSLIKGCVDNMNNGYLGPSYSNKQIEKAIEKNKLNYENLIDKEVVLCETIVQALQEEKLIGYFSGRMEFGPRALGNRSIIADPRPKNMLKRANNRIKLREYWRPLAPIVLSEYLHDVFNTPLSDPYMLFTSKLKAKYHLAPTLKTMRERGVSELHQFLNNQPSLFPAVTHYDYSARTQSLSENANPRLHAIMTLFYQQTNCPMLLNTSFNVRGEPIVCSPNDAIRAFLNTSLDMLVIGDFIINRAEQCSKITNKKGQRKFDAD